jgi:hypothetical protein
MGGTEVTGINLAASDTVVGGNLLAFRTVDSFRPTSFFEEVKAGIVSGKLGLKIFDSVGLHFLSPFIPTLYHRLSVLSRDNCVIKCRGRALALPDPHNGDSKRP